ncbi:MAG: iron-sulfur cluster-binding domain-containing protein, partial [Oceanococcaceae bacterium]
ALTQCAPGQRLHMAGPTGDFVLPETLPARYVFLAAGSGITPVIHLLDTVLKRQPDARVHLFYGSRTEAGILFRERLQAREQAHPGLTVHHVLSQPDASWSGLRGRLRADLLNDVPELSDSECYICGPGDCIAQLDAALRDRSVPASRIHSEHYTAGVHAVAAHPTEPHPVRFAQSGKDITVRPGESILEAGLRSGLDLPFSCTMGGCGHCKLSLSSGTLIMDEPNCLDPRERDDGAFLACCAYPTSRMEVQA